jgi:hypothetical protein
MLPIFPGKRLLYLNLVNMKKSAFLILHFCLLVFFLRSQDFSENNKSAKQLYFRENKGQVSDQFFNPRTDILFSGEAGNIAIYLRNNGVSYQLHRMDKWEEAKRSFGPGKSMGISRVPATTTLFRLDVNWVGASSQPQIVKGENLPGYDNYYLASCPDGAVNVRSFAYIIYKNIYPGIDLKWYEKNGDLKYDYYLAPNADYKQIQMEYNGADKIFVDPFGELVIETPLGTIKEQAPVVIQNNKILEAKWIVQDTRISFDIKNSDPSLPLLIDPMVRLWGTYYGGSGDEWASYIHTNTAGDVFIAGGSNSSSNIATTGVHQTTFAGPAQLLDGYLVKLNSAGVRQWSTYYGGTGDDYTMKSVTDPSGNVYVTGRTES